MISSMTGFARADRYLEANFRLPEGFRQLEPELKALTSSKLNRGKTDASLYFQASNEKAPELELNTALAEHLVGHSQTIADMIDDDGKVSPVAILRWPGVLQDKPVDMESLLQPATELLSSALSDLCSSRASEGQRIAEMLEERLQQILNIAHAVKARLPEVLESSRARMKERAATLEQKIDNERLEQELLILAQKQDVAEELDRLEAHVAEVREALVGEQPVGRRLDFMMQELNREANTLGSKSADPETSKHAVDLKVLIEQMREQVQNVE